MPDAGLHPRSAFDGIGAPGRFGALAASAGVSLREVTGRGLASVAARQGRFPALDAAARRAFGCELPARPRLVAGKGIAFLWAGPEQWLAMLDGAGPGGAEAALAGPFKGLASVAEQSDGRAILRVGGPAARAALAKGLPIDLHERAFNPGDVALTSAAHIPVHLWQVDMAPTYEILVARSFAGSFWHWLTLSCAEFGYSVESVSPAPFS